jgi:hypothetical protein
MRVNFKNLFPTAHLMSTYDKNRITKESVYMQENLRLSTIKKSESKL